MSRFRILYDCPEFVAVDKPYGYHVHPPEDERFRISKTTNGLALLRDQLGKYVYPVHRLDRSTSGVVLYALSSEAASALGQLFANREIEKTYFALVRGQTSEAGRIESPLAEEGKAAVEARTDYRRIGHCELPWVNERFPTSRYSLLRVSPSTGRYHQIRRHLRRENYPIVGDTVYGDGVHNRHWRNETGRPYLFLKAYSLRFLSPFDGKEIAIASFWNTEWLRIFERIGICPNENLRPK